MSRKTVEVDRHLLENCISDAESAATFRTQSQLWEKVAELYNSKRDLTFEEITPSIVYLRVKQFGLTTKTQPAKIKGGKPNSPVSKKEKLKKFTESFDAMEKTFDAKYKKKIDKARKGSMKSAIALKCLDCACFVVAEIRDCTCNSCPLFPYRPYQ